MTIDEAIEYINKINPDCLLIKEEEAIQLGIEALEIIQDVRNSKNLDKLVSTTLDKIFSRFPSETEEGK